MKSNKEICQKSDLDKMTNIYLEIGVEGEQKVRSNDNEDSISFS